MKFKSKILTSLLVSNIIFISDRSLHGAEEATRVLGYDPHISLIRETDETVINTGRKTVYFHGFGGNSSVAAGIKHLYGAERLPGDVVTFDFADAVTTAGMDTTKSSLGQWPDMKTALYVLKTLHDSGETAVGITAHSRGGATAVNTVAALVDETTKYDENLAEIGIDGAKRKAMLKMLQRGQIVLECPLVHVRSVIKHQVETSRAGSWLTRMFGDSLSSSSASTADYCASAVVRKYRPWNEQAIESAEKWNNIRIPTIVHFQENDEVLGNRNDHEFYEKLSASNGVDHTERHVGADGGHNSSFASFYAARNAFLQARGASYKPFDRGGK